MSEKAYENKLKASLKSSGAYFVKYFGCAFSASGVPDILACVNGRFLGIEVKAVTGRPSPLQLHNLKAIDAAGGIALLAYPKDYDAVMSIIEALKSGGSLDGLYEPFRKRFL